MKTYTVTAITTNGKTVSCGKHATYADAQSAQKAAFLDPNIDHVAISRKPAEAALVAADRVDKK